MPYTWLESEGYVTEYLSWKLFFLVFALKSPTFLYTHLKKGLKGMDEIMMSESVKQATILFYSEGKKRESWWLPLCSTTYKFLSNMKNQLTFSHTLGLCSFFLADRNQEK